MIFEKKNFYDNGFAGPFKICDTNNRSKILNERYIPKNKYQWSKSIHEVSHEVQKLAANEIILEKVKKILGDDILLWGSCFIEQKPNIEHSWHTDLEYNYWDGVTVWIGLKNLSKDTPLSLISNSHNLNTFPQLLAEKGMQVKNDESVLKASLKEDDKCKLRNLFLEDGEFVMWSGKLWHKTKNFGIFCFNR